ncbi:MAG: hypothetical protein R3261_02260 [Alphaproteobacteria bacterium]|nr:hypothetical protein [Alphaproteobacteria bacterium]
MKRKLIAFLLLTPIFSFAALGNASAEEGEYGVLVPDVGVEETYGYCAACHSEKIVAQQGLTRQDWAELFVWMVEEQDMPEIEEPELSLILNYLEKN